MARLALTALIALITVACQSTTTTQSTSTTSAVSTQQTQAASAASVVSSEGTPAASAPAKRGAPVFARLGPYKREVTTRSDEARRYFSQGMVLAYGFNHAEAARSFRQAARLDPECAACWWGVALVLGPNINLPMMETDVPEAFAAAQKAASLMERASPVEAELITALTKRYAEKPVQDRAPLDRAYADAMRQVAKQFPQDADVLSLFAESLLDLSPWDYWLESGQPKETTVEAMDALERAMALNAQHPGALHYYIHAVEKVKPELATPAADRLRNLVPDAGHLVHMPGHIYIRTGRYKDAVDVNLQAGEADMSYIAQCNVQGFYPLLYHPHNWHFVWAAATFGGNREQALMGAERTQHVVHGQSVAPPLAGIVNHFEVTPLYAAVRFGMWDRILDAQAPPGMYPRAVWHYARGAAYAGQGDLAKADQELAQLREFSNDAELEKTMVSSVTNAKQLVAIAERMLAGDIAARRKDYKTATASLREAMKLEDSLGYSEPEDWHYPVRPFLGAVLLEAGKPGEAATLFKEDLVKHPENGWALFGLAQALEAQGMQAAATDARRRFDAAWTHADVKLTAAVIR